VNWQDLLLVGPVLLFSVVAHEYAHGYAALKQGDLTAYQLGRLTWNPIKHIDPFLTIIMPVMLALVGAPIFGGAKPVPVNPRNYRNYKRGDIIVSMAGIVANLVIAVLCLPAIILVGIVGAKVPALLASAALLQQMLIYGIVLNMVLIMFNLIPIPPLDGSHVFKYLLPPQWALNYQRLGGAGLLILLLLLSFGRGLFLWWMTPAFVAQRVALRIAFPWLLPSPF
jgi:Zn-dependent protease